MDQLLKSVMHLKYTMHTPQNCHFLKKVASTPVDKSVETCFPSDDSSLIQLSPMEGQTDCQREYINASYIAVRVLIYSVICEPLVLCVL